MQFVNTLATVFATITVFLFAIGKFSKQLEQSGEVLKKWMLGLAGTPLRGLISGAIFTTFLQSSAAAIVTTQSLVDAGVLTFKASLGVVFGANIGTTITSQIIAHNLTFIAGYIVLIGFVLDHLKNTKYQKLGKGVFYFGLIFFCLSLISLYLEPLKTNPAFISLLSLTSNFWVAIMFGAIFTALFQSSSITSGLAVILAGQGVIDFPQAFAIVLGANVGTTSTALIAMLVMGREAKKTAMAHFLFNLFGLIIILPFINPFSNLIESLGGGAGAQVANAHLLFNLSSAVLFLIFIKPFSDLINKLVPGA